MMLVLAGTAFAETRVALVIGNGKYEFAEALPNPANDATDISLALENLGFDVSVGLDLTHDQMAQIIAEFGTRAEASDVALVFYAGHGFQVSGQNYLLPIDGAIAKTADLPDQTISMQAVLGALDAAPGLKIIMLDACRDNPFGDAVGELDNAGNGLARLGSDADLMIVYATQPDNVAYDGVGRNSFFTEAVLSHIFTPGQNISDMMINVRRDVLAATGGRQIPWDSSSLTRQFLFDQSPQTVSEETLLWQVAASGRNPQLLNIYLQRYPEGKHTGSVQAMLQNPVTRQSVIDNPARTVAQAADLWALARRTRMRQLVEIYIEQHPDGANAEEARALLEALPSIEDVSVGRICEVLATHPGDATANTAGVSIVALAEDASLAINTCRDAIAQSPRLPHYRTLLARAYLSRGDYSLAVEQYEAAAAMGDLRAMFTLGLLYENGTGVEPDFDTAIAHFRQSAAGGLPDALINWAYELYDGTSVPQDKARAATLMQQAADQAHPLALFNMALFALEGLGATPAAALGYAERAGVAGYAQGYYLAATILDDGAILPKAPDRASRLLLLGMAEGDSALAATFFTELWSGEWDSETLRAVQSILTAAEQYNGPLNGVFNEDMKLALIGWRTGGFRPELLLN